MASFFFMIFFLESLTFFPSLTFRRVRVNKSRGCSRADVKNWWKNKFVFLNNALNYGQCSTAASLRHESLSYGADLLLRN